MKKRGRLKRIAASVINVRAWSSYDNHKDMTKGFKELSRKVFLPEKKPGYSEEFEVAMQRLNLSEADIAQKKHRFLYLSIGLLLLAFIVFAYAIYHLINQNWLALPVSLVLTGLPLVLAFRYHFWYFQLKQRKLGCTLGEWFRQGLLGERS